jgi:predicted RNA-binding Zn-ribbon protein involved in translation (DUF1610 family)
METKSMFDISIDCASDSCGGTMDFNYRDRFKTGLEFACPKCGLRHIYEYNEDSDGYWWPLFHPVELIECVAIHGENSEIWSLPRPNRHHHLIAHMEVLGHSMPIMGTQGFVTNLGRFVDRAEALKIAIEGNQISKDLGLKISVLISENLW